VYLESPVGRDYNQKEMSLPLESQVFLEKEEIARAPFVEKYLEDLGAKIESITRIFFKSGQARYLVQTNMSYSISVDVFYCTHAGFYSSSGPIPFRLKIGAGASINDYKNNSKFSI
jgi:hypothetical protein